METLVQNKEYTYLERKELMAKLCQRYAQMVPFSAGKSVMGRDISAIKIGNASDVVLFAGAFHGSERITATLLLLFAETLCCYHESDGVCFGIRTDRIFEKRSLVLVPTVNPDGCEISQCGASAAGEKAGEIRNLSSGDTTRYNANARGVDINHNFPASWNELHARERAAGIFGPAPTRYGGPSAASEPETAALMQLCMQTPFHHVVAFHTQGEVIYHRYGKETPPQSEKMAELMSVACGYSIEEPAGLAAGGGFKDWFIHTFHRPGFTVEAGKGANPLPAEDLFEIFAKIAQMMVFSVIM